MPYAYGNYIRQFCSKISGKFMIDLDIAKSRLFKKKLTLSIVKNNEILFETVSDKISGFLYAIDKLGAKLEGSSVADRVAGKAVALLCVYVKVKAVYADVLSKNAKAVFERNSIQLEWKSLVANILDLNQSEICPFEKAAMEISNPIKAYLCFRALSKSFGSSC